MQNPLCECEKNMWQKHFIWCFAYLLIYLIINSYLIGRTGLHQDEVLDWQGSATDTYAAAGRWGLYFWRIVMGPGAFPVTAGVIAGVFIVVAVHVQTILLSIQSNLSRFLYAGIYLSCTQWASQLIYSFQSDAVAFGVLCATFSVLLLQRGRYCSAVIALVAALSFYQTLGIYFYVLLVCVELCREGFHCRRGVIYGCVIISSLLLYALITLLIKQSFLISEETAVYVRLVQESMNQWGTFANIDLIDKLIFVAHYTKITIYNALGIGNEGHFVYTTALIPLGFLLWRQFRSHTAAVASVRVFLLLSVWIAPFILTIIMGVEQGQRVALAEPLALACLWNLALKAWTLDLPKRLFLVGCVCFALLKAAYSVSSSARSFAYEYQHAVHELREMYFSACTLAREKGISDCPVIVFGIPQNSQYKHGCVSPALFRTGCLNWYASHYRMHLLRAGNAADMKRHAAEYHSMPVWPAPGSMKMSNGEVIIRVH